MPAWTTGANAMLLSFEEVVAQVQVEEAELTVWVQQSWVRPSEENGRYLFDPADLARVQLIAELVRDLDVSKESLPVVLRLLDQVYGLRKTLGDLHDAIERLPDASRSELEKALQAPKKP